ncbi:MAG: PhoH family protein [Flavobacteriales bacterium]|nr:PhoH family protein [Bacteroidota bacterium]MCB9240043.1 PhoH family protein [Flavobacteriales bacterium]
MGKKISTKKIYVIDTSVILYDHHSVENFEDNDVAIPIQVLEELDTFKKGGDTKNYEARSFIRYLNSLSDDSLLNNWTKIGTRKGSLKVVKESPDLLLNASKTFDDYKNDNKIINAALTLQEEFPRRKVVLVSKDICLRVKARAFNLMAEDYQTGKVTNLDNLYTGKSTVDSLESTVIDELFAKQVIPVKKVSAQKHPYNHFLIMNNGKKSALGYYNSAEESVEKVEKQSVFRIKPRNAEQAFAIHALMKPEIKLVTLRGVAGTGKTLMALAAALEQRRMFHQIYVTRPIVPLSNKDIGYLPGDVKSKIDPYMQPIWDNLKFIKSQFTQKDKEYRQIEDMVNAEKIAIAPLAYIRGRTLSNVFFIVDEAQNLTPHEVKTIITRAGENTKIVFTGDINQIDTPYLDAESNGLSFLIDKVKNHPLFAHVNLERGERSELANLANELL